MLCHCLNSLEYIYLLNFDFVDDETCSRLATLLLGHLNPFVFNVTFYTPWKHRFSDVFRGYRNVMLGTNKANSAAIHVNSKDFILMSYVFKFNKKDTRTKSTEVLVVSLLSTLNIFGTVIWCFFSINFEHVIGSQELFFKISNYFPM